MNNIFLNNIFYAFLSGIFSAFFCLLGVIGMMMPWAAQVRGDVVRFIVEDTASIFLFGFGFFFIGITILINIILNARKRFYHLPSGKQAVVLDEILFKQYLEQYWKRLFPNCEVSHQLMLKKNKLHIVTDLPHVPLSQQKLLLERIRIDLEELFSRMLGYRGEFLLSVSFDALKE